MLIKHKFVYFIFLFMLVSVFANAANFPKQCSPVNFKFDQHQVILNTNNKTSQPHVFLLHNISKQNFWLDHTVAHPSASAGWASALNAGQWSAIILNQNAFNITCSQMQAGGNQLLDCQKLLEVCELQNISFKNSSKRSYWLAENMSLEKLMKQVQKRGVKI